MDATLNPNSTSNPDSVVTPEPILETTAEKLIRAVKPQLPPEVLPPVPSGKVGAGNVRVRPIQDMTYLGGAFYNRVNTLVILESQFESVKDYFEQV